MDTVIEFSCVYLEFPPNYSPGDEYTRHTASFALDAPREDIIALMTSPLGSSTEAQAEVDFGVVLDLTAWSLGGIEYGLGYTIGSPQFMAGYSGTVEERTVSLADTFRALIDPLWPCSGVVYTSTPATL